MDKKKRVWAALGWGMTAAQSIASILFIYFLYQTSLVPNRYIVYLGLLLSLAIIVVICVEKWRPIKGHIAGLILCAAFIGVFTAGYHYISLIEQSLDSISIPVAEEVDVMVVAVRGDDPAQDITDAKEYLFGVSNMAGSEKGTKSVAYLNEIIGNDIKTVTLDSPMKEVEALLSNQCDAIVYNEAYTGTLEEGIGDYSNKVRVLYRFNLKTDLPERENISKKENTEQEKSGVEKPFTVYISGIDVEGPISTTSRSDVNILMTINPDTHWILLTTTPRDYYVYIPDVSGDNRDKLTHAGIYGIQASISTLEELYGVHIDYYVRVNFTSLITIVDALDGVDVYSEYTFDVGDFSYVEGMNHLSGIEALAFSRERYAFKEGDNQRGKNQQAVLSAIIDKITSYQALSHADELLAVVSDCTQTSIPKDEIKKLVKRQMDEGIQWKIFSQAATGTGDHQPTYSTGKMELYVMWPSEQMVESLSDNMDGVLKGNDPISLDTIYTSDNDSLEKTDEPEEVEEPEE